MGWLIDLITRLVAMLFHRPAPTPPESQEAVQAASAASAEAKLSGEVQTALLETKVAQAVTQAPKDVQGVVVELRKGTF